MGIPKDALGEVVVLKNENNNAEEEKFFGDEIYSLKLAKPFERLSIDLGVYRVRETCSFNQAQCQSEAVSLLKRFKDIGIRFVPTEKQKASIDKEWKKRANRSSLVALQLSSYSNDPFLFEMNETEEFEWSSVLKEMAYEALIAVDIIYSRFMYRERIAQQVINRLVLNESQFLELSPT